MMFAYPVGPQKEVWAVVKSFHILELTIHPYSYSSSSVKQRRHWTLAKIAPLPFEQAYYDWQGRNCLDSCPSTRLRLGLRLARGLQRARHLCCPQSAASQLLKIKHRYRLVGATSVAPKLRTKEGNSLPHPHHRLKRRLCPLFHSAVPTTTTNKRTRDSSSPPPHPLADRDRLRPDHRRNRKNGIVNAVPSRPSRSAVSRSLSSEEIRRARSSSPHLNPLVGCPVLWGRAALGARMGLALEGRLGRVGAEEVGCLPL